MTEKTPTPPPVQKEENLGTIINDFFSNVGLWFKDFVDIKAGVDKEGTIIDIKKNMRMRGHSAWLLMCSIMIASLGLDLNSPAVIIGAMLISPLMSPILGIGLAIGVNDRKMLSVSLQHFAVSIVIALITSFLYFKFTPFGNATPEIMGRTEPTTLDVLVAFFGGLAGIISGSRKDKSNAIPGVAIATALMPPLCVTGFGLANNNLSIMAGSFYLFFLNTVFVALATYLIVRMLRFPAKEFASEIERRRTQFFIASFSILMIIPSALILSREIQDLNYRRQVNEYVDNYFSGETQCLDYEIEKLDSTRLLVLKLIGPSIDEDSIDFLEQRLQERVSLPTKLSLVQDTDIDLEELAKIRSEVTNVKQLTDQLESNYKNQAANKAHLDEVVIKQDSMRRDSVRFQTIAKEAKIFLADLQSMQYAKMQSTDFESFDMNMPTLLVRWKAKKTNSSKETDEQKLYEFVKQKAKLDTLQIISY